MKEQFIGQYPLSKTLQFSLIPIGKTEENFNKKCLLEEDEKRAEEYQKVKGYIDRYHKFFIETSLKNITLDNLDEYASLYYKSSKSDADNKEMSNIEAKLRKQISKTMTSHELYKDLFSENIIKTVLPEFLDKEEEKESVEMFKGFFTYFSGFNTNRKNMYSEEAQSTAIAYRCINDNLPKFLDNAKSFERIKESLDNDKIEALNEEFYGTFGIYATDIFNVDYFNFVLTQPGIDKYNGIIGGYTCSDGTKIQGFNEIVNLYNQQVAKSDKSRKLPLLKVLYKQILSDKETVSFVPDKFKSDDEVIISINKYLTEGAIDAISSLKELFSHFDSFNMDGIHIMSGPAVTDLSNAAFGSWSAFSSSWEKEYTEVNPKKKNKSQEKYDEEMKAEYKKISSFSLAKFQRLALEMKSSDSIGSVANYYKVEVPEKAEIILDLYSNAKELLTCTYSQKYDKKLIKNENVIEQIKNLLDAIKSLEKLLKPLMGTGKEELKDELFYGEFLPLYDLLALVDSLYDKVRNYVTQKPYSKDKIKLNFENPQFLGGWPYTKELDYSSFLLRKDGIYYLAIIDSEFRTKFKDCPLPESEDDTIEKMRYCQVADPAKDIPNLLVIDGKVVKKNGRKDKTDGINHLLEEYRCQYLPEEINRIRISRSFSKGSENFCKSDLSIYISYYQNLTKEYFSDLKFNFKPAEEYDSFAEFTDDVNAQGYNLSFFSISKRFIEDCVNEGSLYLFKIYNKDFSEYSHGTPNLHTMYFKMLFDEQNLDEVVFKLNGGSEMFFRKSSIKENEKIIHAANQPIKNKNPDNPKKQSTFEYELVKDKRYTERQFSIHIPITINFKAYGREFINYDVRSALKSNDRPYVIGIDRGERNLIYISVVNDKGEMVEQMSLNEIIDDTGYRVDYQNLLDRKEKERDAARKSWGTIENIKELKEGYISQVVHKICELVVKYDAIIAMEDLNFGFKRGRFSVEKQVYQKFENMLISKLNYLCDKKADPSAEGGLLKAYQLTNKFDGVNKGKQNGIIFYVPAWLTSKIDPVTGFVDLLHPKYTSVEETHKLFDSFEDIRYNVENDMFEFDMDYSKFPKCNADYKRKWTVYTNADRIMTFRNPEKNNEWDNKRIVLSDEFKKLFEEFGVDYRHDIKKSILNISNKDFNYRLVKLLALTLQMRNSVTGSTNPEDDYLISPVKDVNGVFYDSRNFSGSDALLPIDADANGAYNIARKGLWAIDVIKSTPNDELDKVDLSISNAKWLEYVQK